MIGIIGAGLALLVIQFVRGQWPSSWPLSRAGFLVLMAGWWFLGTSALFFISNASTVQVFVSRYLGSSAPADAILLAAIGTALFQERAAVGWAVLAVLLTTGSPREWRHAWRISAVEARPMIAAVRTISPVNPPPILFFSSLVESNFLDWRSGLSGSYLFTELIAYPIPNRVLPLPTRLEVDIEYHITGLLDSELKDAPEIVFVRGGELPEWVTIEMTSRGYRVERLRPNAYSIAVFRK